MPKFMNMKNLFFLNLQFFAEENSTGDDAGDGDDHDDDSDDDSDEGGDDEPKFTQADLDKAVARTIAKERAKAERAAKKKDQKNKDKDSAGSGESEDTKARKEAEAKASSLEVKVACFEAGVSKDAVDDVAALARSYMVADEDLDLVDAIEKVVKNILCSRRALWIRTKMRTKPEENHGGRDRTVKHQRKCPVLKRSSMSSTQT